jgi:hypothetical protein
VGRSYSFRQTASDADGNPLSFSIANRPGWATFSRSSGRLYGTPPRSAVGIHSNIRIRVSDGKTTASLPAFSITVSGGNRAPTISGTPGVTATSGQSYSFRPTASDADGDTLNFRIANKPGWATFSRSNGRLYGTPPSSLNRIHSNITISVSDGRATTSLPAFSIRVSSGNRAPTISGTPSAAATVGQSYSFRPTAADADGDAVSFSIANKPAWATFSRSSGRLYGTPPSSAAGTFSNIRISVSDGVATASMPAFSITVTGGNRAPTIAGTPSNTATGGRSYSFRLTASDSDGDTLSFSIANKPAWASFSRLTGRLYGTPPSSLNRTHSNIAISVNDGHVTTALPAFSIAVSSGNSPPTISGAPGNVATVGRSYSFRPTASDADGDPLTFNITNRPAWAVFNATNGTLSGTPGSTAVGSYANISISVSDGRSSTSLPAFTITVSATNRAPAISGSPATTATVGSAYSFRPTASDADGDPLTFDITNKPAWAVFNPTNGTLSGTPGSSAIGTHSNIRISVSDGEATTALPAFNIEVSGSPSSSSVTLSWVAPTLNTDGSQLRNLAGFEIHYGTRSRNYDQVLRVVGSGVTSAVIEDLGTATWYFAVLAYTSDGTESDYSAEASKTIR